MKESLPEFVHCEHPVRSIAVQEKSLSQHGQKVVSKEENENRGHRGTLLYLILQYLTQLNTV
jgi:rhodanese-related sulfurtransferase